MQNLAYLVSEFPSVSHTFILGELRMLRARGLNPTVFSINKPRAKSALAGSDWQEVEKTIYVKSSLKSLLCFPFFLELLFHPISSCLIMQRTFELLYRQPRMVINLLGYLLEVFFILRHCRRKRIKHIHVHFANPAATVAYLVSYSGTVDYSISVHGPDEFFNVEANFLKQKFLQAKFLRCISSYCRSQILCVLKAKQAHKIAVVHCGIDAEKFSVKRDHRQRQASEDLRLVSVARLVPVKGQRILLESCSILKSMGVKFHLELVGSGPDLEELKNLASSLDLHTEISFCGALPPDDVFQKLRAAQIFVLTSFAEGLPVVLMEALAMELAVVTTFVNGIPELIENGINGLLVPPANPNATAEAILRLRDADLRLRLGQRGRLKVVEEFSVAKSAAQMLEHLQKHL